MTENGRTAKSAGARQRPVPEPSPQSLPFWRAARTHKLVLPCCRACRKFFFPPSCLCPHCHDSALAWEEVSGRSHVHSFVVVHRISDPAFAEAVPYLPAVIELEEGPRLLSDIVGAAPEHLYCVMPVSVVFDDISAEFFATAFFTHSAAPECVKT